MRLFEIEDADYDKKNKAVAVQYFEIIQRDCGPWLQQNPNNQFPIYRGMHVTNPDVLNKIQIRIEREPVDTPKDLHIKVDQVFKDLDFKATRSNSIFVTGSRSQAANYGTEYVVVPIGEFNFTWSDTIHDLYTDGRGKFKITNLDEIEELLDYDQKFWMMLHAVQRLVTKYPEESREIRSKFNHVEAGDESKVKELFREIAQLPPDLLKDIKTSYYNQMETNSIDSLKNDVKFDYKSIYDYINANYYDKDLIDAIKSGNEIMIHCKEYYAIPRRWYWDHISPLFK